MENLWKDLLYGARLLRKSPAFTLLAVLSLALGMGANTAIFSVVNALLLRPLPVERPEELVGLYRTIKQEQSFNRFSYPNYVDFRDQNDVFANLSAYYFTPLNLRAGDSGARVYGHLVSGNFFATLGINPLLGRFIAPEDDRTPGGHPVAVLSYGLWQRQFGGDQEIVGTEVAINGHAFTVIGVAPASFKGTEVSMAPEIYVPMMMAAQAIPGSPILVDRASGYLRVLGRLKPGVSVQQAQTACDTIADRLQQQYPKENEAMGVAVIDTFTLHPQFRSGVRNFLLVMLGLVGLVLLIACVNVANLLLTRASARRKEIAIRLAMGAGRLRLIQQLLTESTLLAVVGGAAGLLFALWTTDLINGFKPPTPQPVVIDLGLDYRVLSFNILLSLLTGIIFGLVPALQSSRTELVNALKNDFTCRAGARARIKSLFMVAQVALSLVLLISAGLFVRSLQNAQSIDPGFQSQGMLVMSVDLGLQGYTRERAEEFQGQLVSRLSALPGVQGVALSDIVPLGVASDQDSLISVEGYTPPAGRKGVVMNYNIVGKGYFETLGIPIQQGRAYNDQDTRQSQPVVIVNEAFARRFWEGQDAIGKKISFAGAQDKFMTVVGVARDGKYVTLGEPSLPYIYLPLGQRYDASVVLNIRASGDARNYITAIQNEVALLDKNLPVYDVKTMTEHLSLALMPARIAASVLSLFGLVALLLASVGIYGVISYSVEHRTHEIGVRMALGALPGQVLSMVLDESLKIAMIGIVIGLAGALALSRVLAGMLYGVSPGDPATFLIVPLLFLIVALAASFFPARRAMKVDPMVALRYE